MSSLSVWPVGHSGHGSAEPYPAGPQRPPTSVCVSEVCRRSPPPAGPYTLALLVPSQNSYQGPLGQSRTPVTEQNSPFEWSVGLTLSRSLLGRQESHHNLCSFRKKKNPMSLHSPPHAPHRFYLGIATVPGGAAETSVGSLKLLFPFLLRVLSSGSDIQASGS